jgi:hypothetical protein
MILNRKLIVDEFCEVKEFTKAWQDATFHNFLEHDLIPGAIYLISRQQFTENIQQIKRLAEQRIILPILGNPAEGSETMLRQIEGLGIVDLVRQGKILLIVGGYMQEDIPALYHENFLPKILDYSENLQAIQEYQTQYSTDRPYKFLFLNGRARSHRRHLLRRLQPVLDQAIWSNLDNTHGTLIKLLDSKYEFDFYQKNTTALTHSGFVKYKLFNNDWGEIYLNYKPYADTYFSLVTETVFDYPYSFRTEKIWKPIAIGHPFIVASNAGYYRDLHQLGFQTFRNVIDESFDQIDNNQDRLNRIAQVVTDLCQQDLASFLNECYNVCKYNQNHLAEMQIKIRKEFPNHFKQYLQKHSES